MMNGAYTRRRNLGFATSSSPAEIMNNPTNSTTRTIIGGRSQYHNPNNTELVKIFQ